VYQEGSLIAERKEEIFPPARQSLDTLAGEIADKLGWRCAD
jgi:hypothetical protein